MKIIHRWKILTRSWFFPEIKLTRKINILIYGNISLMQTFIFNVLAKTVCAYQVFLYVSEESLSRISRMQTTKCWSRVTSNTGRMIVHLFSAGMETWGQDRLAEPWMDCPVRNYQCLYISNGQIRLLLPNLNQLLLA